MKNKTVLIFSSIILILIVIILVLCPLGIFIPKELDTSASLVISPSIQKRQGLNQCGPYSVMAVINSLTGTSESPDLINAEMKWRLKNQMTIPFGLTSSLRQYGIHTRHKLLILQNQTRRIRYIKWRIEKGHPLILLNQTEDGIQHYFTLLGYTENQFYLYDSLQPLPENANSRITIDDNGIKPGNLTLNEEVLQHRWGNGGKYFFRWYLIESY